MKRLSLIILAAAAAIASGCGESNVDASGKILRGEATDVQSASFEKYCDALVERNQNVQSIMVVHHGKVIFEKWMNGGDPDVPHVMNSVSKTFSSIATGFAIEEGLFGLDDRLVDLFPDKVTAEGRENYAAVTVRSILTMSCGQGGDFIDFAPWGRKETLDIDWVEHFFQIPVIHEPFTVFCYNNLGAYMLSAAVQKYSGQKVVDYLQDRLLDPLGIEHPYWEVSPQDICCGAWGLYLKTEDMAKVGLCLLQNGKWNGRQVIPEWWVKEMTARQIDNSNINGTKDWSQGYGYQMWRCINNAVRADGADGQYILLIPDKDAVVAVTADLPDMQRELDTIWDYIYPVL